MHERSVVNQTVGLPELDLENISDSDSDCELNLMNSTPVVSALPSKSCTYKSEPVAKWNLKFTGENKDLSLSAFLERVDEMRIARNVSELELFNSAIDLFSGQALIWFRSARKKVNNWMSLVTLLREQFQPADYNEKLYEEIKKRTQGSNESLGVYLAVMNNLFDRLSISVPEATRLKILRKNISPFYQTQLALELDNIESIDQLLKLGRKLEDRRTVVENFNPPPSRKSCFVLEPDLAYIDSRPSTSSCNACEIQDKPTYSCYNCGKAGHKARQCNQEYRRYCYKCKKPNYTIKTCPNCNHHSGNAARRH